MTILGISIGTKCTGICILEDGKLKNVNVHRFDDIWSGTKLHVIINRYKQYIRQYGVTSIIVKTPPGHNYTKALRQVKHRIELLAKQFYCDFATIQRKEIKGSLDLATVDDLVAYTLQYYPDLYVTYERQSQSKHCKFRKLYEALLAAHIAHLRKTA